MKYIVGDEPGSEFQLISGRLKSPTIINWRYMDNDSKNLNTQCTLKLWEISQDGGRYAQHMRNGEDKASSTTHTSDGAELLMGLEGILLLMAIKTLPPLDSLSDV